MATNSDFFSSKMEDILIFEDKEKFDSQNVLSIRPMRVAKDLAIIHRWFNLQYSERFWRMNGISLEHLSEMYKDDQSHFVILINNVVIAYFEIYFPFSDELSKHYRFDPSDIGFHFLLGPGKEIIKRLPCRIFNLTRSLLVLIIHFIFEHSTATCVYVEPDVKNNAATRLADRVGFDSKGILNLSYKSANLFGFEKGRFYYRYKCLS